jgi:general L-amino acid transport system permease protein
MADITQGIPIAAQAPPPRSAGTLGWLKTNLFNGITNTIFTLLCLVLLAIAVPPVIRWGLIDAIWHASNGQACRGNGACWAFIGEKFRFILFGFFPVTETWRPIAVLGVFLVMIVTACSRRMWGARLGILWLVGLGLVFALMRGGFLGMSEVETEKWSGLPLTLILAVFGMVCAFPFGVLLALGRRSKLPAVRTICVGYIELIRGVPLITLLFMASLMLPLFLPAGITIDKLVRAQVAFILFAGAYLAEVVRGGLQAIPRGQIEAADALGLSYIQRTRLIVLPQALAMVIPPLVNTFIGIFKATALVIIISLFDLLNTAETALSDANWQGFYVEDYVFIAVIYWSFCFFMSRYSQLLELEFNRGTRR